MADMMQKQFFVSSASSFPPPLRGGGQGGGILSSLALALSIATPATVFAAEPAAESPPPKETSAQTAGPAVNTSPATPAPAANPAPGQRARQRVGASDRLDLSTTVVTGNRELPKVLYIVPWKKADIGDLPSQPFNTLLDEVLTPVDRDVFRREVTYYGAVSSAGNTAAPASPVPANGSEK